MVMEEPTEDQRCEIIGAKRQPWKSRKDILEKSQTHILQSASYLRSTITEEPAGDQRCGTIVVERQLRKLRK